MADQNPQTMGELAQLYGQCFDSYAGRIVLRDLKLLYYDKAFFSLDGDKPVDLSRLGALEGQRQVVLRILHMMHLAEDLKVGETLKTSAQQTHAETDSSEQPEQITLKGDG